MSLSCECGDGDGEEWWYEADGYSTLDTERRRRCVSCKDMIAVGAIVAKFHRARATLTDVEERIYDDGEVPLAPKFMCERCADLYFSLAELGYCIQPDDDMRELVKEYAQMKHAERLSA